MRTPLDLDLNLDLGLDSCPLFSGCPSWSLPLPLDEGRPELLADSHGGVPFTAAAAPKGETFPDSDLHLFLFRLIVE